MALEVSLVLDRVRLTLLLAIRVEATCWEQKFLFAGSNANRREAKKAAKTPLTSVPRRAPHDAAEGTGGREGGSSASEMRGLCGAVWYTVPRRGCPLCAFLYSAHPRVLSFLPRSFLFPPARRCRQDPKPLPACLLARSLRRETQASVVLGPSRAFGRPARLSWNPGRIRGFSFCSPPSPAAVSISLFSYVVFRERKMLLDSLDGKLGGVNVANKCYKLKLKKAVKTRIIYEIDLRTVW